MEIFFSRAIKILVENGVLLFLTECGALCSLRTCLDFYVFFVSVSTYFYPRGYFYDSFCVVCIRADSSYQSQMHCTKMKQNHLQYIHTCIIQGKCPWIKREYGKFHADVRVCTRPSP